MAYDYDPYDSDLRPRVVYDVVSRYSQVITPGLPDLVPVSFSGPPRSTIYAVGDEVVVTANVQTRDGVLAITHEFHWRAGTSVVQEIVTIKNISPKRVRLTSYKPHRDVDRPKSSIPEGRLPGPEIFVRPQHGGWWLAGCPDPYGGTIDCPTDPWVPGGYSFIGEGMLPIVTDAANDEELRSATANLTNVLRSVRIGKDLQITLFAAGGDLDAGKTKRFMLTDTVLK